MQLHNLQPQTSKKTAKRIGRGGKRGKTSGRGHKGQKARTGNSTRPEMRDIIKKIPKLRGHGKNRAKTVHAERNLPTVINLSKLDVICKDGDTISPAALVALGVLSKEKGKLPAVKVLGTGDITKKITLSGCTYSASAKAKIEKAGGSVL